MNADDLELRFSALDALPVPRGPDVPRFRTPRVARGVPFAAALSGAVLLAVVAAAVGWQLRAFRDDRPAASSRPAESPAPTVRPPAVHVRVTGSVTDAPGVGVPDARVIVRDGESGAPLGTAATGGDGHYDLALELRPADGRLGLVIEATKGGYERDLRELHLNPLADSSMVQQLRLHPVTVLLAGQSIRLTVTPDDPLCSYLGDAGAGFVDTCRTVRIVVPGSGTLAVDVIAEDDPGPIAVQIHGPGLPGYVCCGLKQRVHVANPASGGFGAVPGPDTVAEILYIDDRQPHFGSAPTRGPQRVTVRTTFEPD